MLRNKILLIGLGKMGFGIAYFLQKFGCAFDVFDLDKTKERSILESFNKSSLKDENTTYDVIILSLPPKALVDFVRQNSHIGKIFLTITRLDYQNFEEYQIFNNFLIQKKITLVCGLGLEPGLSEICTQTLIKDKNIQNLEVYCGGVPLDAKPPFFYDIVFGNKLPADFKAAFTKIEGRLVKAKRFDEVEDIFIPNIGLLESYQDGLIPYLAEKKNMPNIRQKTLRWKGFASAVKVLREAGMFESRPLPELDISPNDFLHLVLKRNQTKTKDMVILYVRADDNCLTIISKGSEELSAMAKTTAFPICFAIKYLSHKPLNHGIIWGYDFFTNEESIELISQMEESNLIEIYE